MSLQEQFAKDVTAAEPGADMQWVASNDIAAAFQLSADAVLKAPANENAHTIAWETVAKRTLDLVVAICALVLLAPVLAVLAAIVWLDDGGSVFFRQTRLGLGGKPFNILKFRTMSVQENGDTIVQAKENDRRITRAGKWLRATSLDELPQLLNVIAGDMSVVGPRPHARAHDQHYEALIQNYALRQTVKPGMTGWAQVNGLRGETPTVADMKARVDHDLYYVRNASLGLDLAILARTPSIVFSARNAR